MVAIEVALGDAHLGVLLPRLGDHHHDRLGQRTAGQHQKLQRVVEHGRVGAVLVDDGQGAGQVVTKRRRAE